MATFELKAYGLFAKSLANKEVDLDSDTLKAMLCTSAYTPDQDTHQYKSDVTNEVTGTGYTAGGQSLSNVTVTYNAATNALILDADDPVWPASSITARVVVIYDDTPSTNKPLIAYGVFSENVSSTSASFTVQLPLTGILSLTAAS